MAVFTN